jgi:hypothetical protein
MKIKRFFESVESDRFIIDDYFSELSEGGSFDKEIRFTINEINENLFKVYIQFKIDKNYNIDIYPKLDLLEKKNDLKSKIFKYIKSSILGLLNDDSVDDIKIHEEDFGYEIEVLTKLKGNIEDWIYVDDDQSITYDERRFRKLMKNKFNVNVVSSSINMEAGRYGEEYPEMSIALDETPTKEKIEEIKKYMLSIIKYFPIYGEDQKLFINLTNRESQWIYLEFNDLAYIQ